MILLCGWCEDDDIDDDKCIDITLIDIDSIIDIDIGIDTMTIDDIIDIDMILILLILLCYYYCDYLRWYLYLLIDMMILIYSDRYSQYCVMIQW